MGGREIVKTKATATGTTLTGGEQIVEGVANRQQLTTAEYKQFQLTERQ